MLSCSSLSHLLRRSISSLEWLSTSFWTVNTRVCILFFTVFTSPAMFLHSEHGHSPAHSSFVNLRHFMWYHLPHKQHRISSPPPRVRCRQPVMHTSFVSGVSWFVLLVRAWDLAEVSEDDPCPVPSACSNASSVTSSSVTLEDDDASFIRLWRSPTMRNLSTSHRSHSISSPLRSLTPVLVSRHIWHSDILIVSAGQWVNAWVCHTPGALCQAAPD